MVIDVGKCSSGRRRQSAAFLTIKMTNQRSANPFWRQLLVRDSINQKFVDPASSVTTGVIGYLAPTILSNHYNAQFTIDFFSFFHISFSFCIVLNICCRQQHYNQIPSSCVEIIYWFYVGRRKGIVSFFSVHLHLGLCCAVMIRSMATIISASRQMVVASVGVYKIDGWKCLVQGLHLICYEIGDCTSTAFIFIISLDRFFAMTSFERYKKFTIRHVQILIGVVFTVALVYYCILAVLIGTIYLSKREVSANCYRGEVLTLLYCKVLISTLLFIFIVTVVLYTIACLVMRCRKVVGSNSVRRNQLKREKVVTKRVAVIIVSTLITHIIPVSFCVVNMWRNQNLLGISSFLLLMHPATLTLDLFLYALLDKDIRRSFSRCVACGRRQRPVCKLHDRTTNCVTPFNIHHHIDDNQAAECPPVP